MALGDGDEAGHVGRAHRREALRIRHRLADLGEELLVRPARHVDAQHTREIAALAGTTERTLFKHFGTKDGLVRAVIQEAVIEGVREKAFARIWDSAPFTCEEFVAWHRMFLTDRITAAKKAPENYRLLFRELLRDDHFRDAFAPKWLEGVFEPLARQLGRMQETGAIPRDQSPPALASSFSLTVGYLVSRFVLMPNLGWSDDRNVDAVVAMFMTTCGALEKRNS